MSRSATTTASASLASRARSAFAVPRQASAGARSGQRSGILRSRRSSVGRSRTCASLSSCFRSPPTTSGAFLHRTCAKLGLSQDYVPHSLRHGCATMLHLLGWTLEDIMLVGRWLSANSARTYIQSGPAMLLDSQIPREIMELGRQLSKRLVHAVELACRR